MDYIVVNKLLTKSIYKQISDSISEAISMGKLAYNDKLPTEKEICQMFSISQTAVKMAYEKLIEEGKIKRIKGKGTYVTNRESHHTDVHQLFTLETDDEVQRKNILIERSNKDLGALRELSLSSDEVYYHTISMQYKHRSPLLKQEVFLPKNMYPDFTDKYDPSMDIYTFLKQVYNVNIKELQSTFSALNASPSDALLLALEPDSAIYLVRSKIIDDNGNIIGYLRNYYPGDFTEIEVIVHAK